MRIKAALAVAILAGGLLLAACASFGQPSVVKLGSSDAGRTISVARGAEVQLALPGNPSTGYGWEAAVERPSILEQSGDPEFKPSSSALGADGTYTFHFKAGAAGTTDLSLVYRRSWETGVTPLKTYRVTIVVS